MTTTTETAIATDKIKDKIFKLLQLANSPNEAEASMAAKAATSLLMEYNLSEQAIRGENPSQKKREVSSGTIAMGVDPTSRDPWKWCITLAQAVAETTFCRALFYDTRRKVMFVGTGENREVAAQLYLYLSDQVLKLADEAVYQRVYHATKELSKGTESSKTRYRVPEILDAVEMVLRETGPLNYVDLTQKLVERNLPRPIAKRANYVVWYHVRGDVLEKGAQSRFRLPKPGVCGLAEHTSYRTPKAAPDVRLFRSSYILGMVDRVSGRLIRGFRDYVATADTTNTGSGTALVRAQDALVKDYLAGMKIGTMAYTRQDVDSQAYERGFEEGKAVELSARTKLA